MLGGHFATTYLTSSGTRIQSKVGAARTPQPPASATSRALTNAKVRRAMRATFGRVAVVLLLSLSMCGCKSGSNMFASWGKKKPASTLSEAPAYKPSNPALPSAGQTPASLAGSASGSNLAAAGAAAASHAASSNSSAVPAGYQQSPYPTTPYSMSKVGNPSATSATAGTAPTITLPAAAPSSSPASSGYAAAVGTGNSLPPAPAYKPAATATASSSQPQNGFYNPAYAGAGSTTAPTAYATAAASNPAYNYNTPAASSAAAGAAPAASSGQGSEIRVADVRAASMPPAAQVAMVGTAPPAAVTNNSASAASAGQSNLVGDRYSNFAASGAAPAATAQPVVTGPATAPAAAQPTSNEYYRPAASASDAGSYSAPEAASSSAAPTSSSAPADSPLRKDSGYRPGGTSDYAPAGNVLRPSSSGDDNGGAPSGSQTKARPASGVVPASYQVAMSNPSPSTPAVATAAAAQPVGDRYSGFQAASNTEPAYGASSPATSQQGAILDHSW